MLTPARRARPRSSGSLTARPDQVEALRRQISQPNPGTERRRSARLQAGATVLIEELAKEDSESDGGSSSGGEGSRHWGPSAAGNVRLH